jgi:multiple sugar transport system substrate-binding protein
MRLDELGPESASSPGSEAEQFLKALGKSFRGTRLRILTEDTPPSAAARSLVEQEFTRLSGIEVDWVFQPLDQVFARTSVDTVQASGHHDLFYIDQSWRGRFADSLEPLEPWLERKDLAYPDWDYDDFLEPLKRHLGSFEERLIAIPYDITLFLGAYRRDILQQLGLEPPRSMPEWYAVCAAVTEAMAPDVYGMTAQWRVGHYALHCNMSTWLWGHGWSFFYADGSPALQDEFALAGLEYMLKLREMVSPEAVTWDWHGEAQAFARGEAALFGSWAEFLPMFDDPEKSRVAGLFEPFAMPLPVQLRAPEDCGFGEAPGVAHQGGSGLALSSASRQKEAAWGLLQWLTSKDIAVRACLLGSGASAVRESTYRDPRILRRADQTGPGSTRYFKILREAILLHMGTEPSHHNWADLSRDHFAVELGKMMTRQQGIRATAAAMDQAARSLMPG